MHPSEPFPHFVDDYLAYLYEVLPSQASLGRRSPVHDDLLEDLSRPAIDAHVRALAGFGRRLQQIDAAPLPPTEQVEHPIVGANIEARMHELETVRSWERNPQVYADALGTSLAGQALFNYAPEADRARRVVSKLRQTPRLVQAARDNIRECPGIFVKIGLETWRGVLKFIETDLPARVFSASTISTSLAISRTPPRKRRTAIKSAISSIWRPISRRGRRRRSVWAGKTSSGS